jgi:lipopolysaccharide transport system permease protein
MEASLPSPRFRIAPARLRYWRDLYSELVSRELKILYKRSALGIAWTLVNPLLQLLVFSFVFRQVLSVRVPNYASFAFTGLLVWTWFHTSTVQAATLITSNRPLIRQPGFPVATLPAVTVLTRLVHFLMALPVLFAFFWAQQISLTAWALLLPLLVGIQFILTLAIAYPVAALNVTLRDVQHILAVVLQMMMYLTPIFYDLGRVPEAYLRYYMLNPFVHLVEAYRDILIRGQAPDWAALAGLAALSIALVAVCRHYYRRQSERFVEEL